MNEPAGAEYDFAVPETALQRENRLLAANVAFLTRELNRLEAERDRLREALQPFAFYAAVLPDYIADKRGLRFDDTPVEVARACPTAGDCRRAKEALDGR